MSFIVIAFLLSLILIIVLYQLIKLWRISKLVNSRIDYAVDTIRQFNGLFGKQEYNRLDEMLKQDDLFAILWEEFSKTTIIEESGDRIQIFNAQPSELFFNFRNIIAERLNLALLEALPGIVTGLGLLGTFIALFLGLHALHVQSDMEVTGIEGLINNLSYKFLSSIFGVFFALLLIVFEKLWSSRLELKCRQLQQSMNKLFPRIITESILNKMLVLIDEQTSQFKHLNSDLSTRLKTSFEESMKPTMDRMVNSIDKLSELTEAIQNQNHPMTEKMGASMDRLVEVTEQFQQQRSEQSSSAIEAMVSKFSERLTTGASNEFSNLSAVLANTSNALGQMTDRMEQSLALLEGKHNTQLRDSEIQRNALAASVSDVLSKLEAHSVNHLTQIENASSGMVDKLRTELNETFSSYRKQQEEHTQLSQQQQQQLSETASSLLNNLTEVTVAQSNKLDSAAESMISKLNQSADLLVQQLSKSASNNSEQSSSLSAANQALQSAIVSVSELLGNSQSVLSEWKGVSNDLSQVTGTLRTSSDQIRQAQQLASTAMAEFISQMKHYEDSMATTQKIWSEQKEQHEWLDQNLAKLLTSLNDAMSKFQEHTHSALGNSLNQFDKTLADAVGRVAGTVKDLDGQLDELTQSLERTLVKVAR